jgi:hypothetical protein
MLINAPMSPHQALDFEALTDHLAKTLIYVIGNARGGSTFANSAIGIHPKVLCVEWNDKTFSDLWFKQDRIDDRALSAQLLKPGKHFDPEIVRAAIGEDNAARWSAHVERVSRTRDLKHLFCIQGLLFWIMSGMKTPLTDFQAWCVKANTWEGFFEIKRHLPATKVVFVERDPRSTSLSLAKVYARQRQEDFADQDVVRGAMDWLRNATEFAVRLHGSRDAHLLYYERLVADPPATLNELYTRLGLEPLPESSFASRLAAIEYTTTKGFAEKSRSNAVGLHTEALARWRTQLTAEQARSVCALTEAAARHYGYDLGCAPKLGEIAAAFRHADPNRKPKLMAVYVYCRLRLAVLPQLH